MRKVGITGQSGSSLCLFTGSTEARNAPHLGNLNANRASLVGHMQVCIKRGEGVLQGTRNKLVSLIQLGTSSALSSASTIVVRHRETAR